MSVGERPLAGLLAGRARLDAGDAIFAGLLVASVVIPLRLDAAPPAERLLPEILSVAIDAGTLWLLLRAAAVPGLDRGSARAFRMFAAGRLFAVIGNLAWYIDELRGVPPAASLSLVPFAAYYACLLAGVLSFPVLFRTRGERTRFWLDALAVLVGGGLVLLLAIGGRQGGTPAETLVFALYALGDLVLLLAAALLLLRRDPRGRGAFLWLACCLVLTLLGDTLAAARALGTAVPGETVPFLVRVARVTLAASAYAFRRQVLAFPGATSVPVRPRGRSWLPYVAIAVGYAASWPRRSADMRRCRRWCWEQAC